MSSPLSAAARLARTGGERLRNQVVASRFAERAGSNGLVPNGAVAVYFATGPENFYQFEQWRRPLERLAERHPVFVVVDRPDTGEQVLAAGSLPVAFARSSGELERLVAERDVRLVCYLNQVEANFRMLRFAAPLHIQLGHGESDKGSSTSNQHKAYDLTFVGGEVGSERLGTALRGFDPVLRTRQIGRPQLDHHYEGAPDWTRDSGLRVWYAPTWEGDRPTIAYGSLDSHGLALVEAVVADPDVRLIYRPHPRTGRFSARHAAADREIRRRLARDGDRHLVDEGGYGWQWSFADACVTDISAVAYDWLATGKPLVVTDPVGSGVHRPTSPLLAGLPLLRVSDIGAISHRLAELGLGRPGTDPDPQLAALSRSYFGDTADQASSRRFAAAVDEAYAMVSGD